MFLRSMKSRTPITTVFVVLSALLVAGLVTADTTSTQATAETAPPEIIVYSAYGVVNQVERLEWPNASVSIKGILYDKDPANKPLTLTVRAFETDEKLDFNSAGIRSKMAAYYLQPEDKVRIGIYRLTESGNWRLKSIERVTSMGGKQEVRVSLGVRPNPVEATSKANLRLTVTNSTSETQVYMMPSGQMFDFQALKDGKEVWRWSDGKMFTMAVSQLRLQPGQTRTFSADWDLVDKNGNKLGPGVYQISGWLAIAEDGKSLRSPAVQLTVN